MKQSEKEVQSLQMPWESEYGYAQAVKKGNMVWVSGQLGHDDKGVLGEGMDEQTLRTYTNIKKVLKAYQMGMNEVVEEVIYTTDMATAFAARKKYGRQFYPDPMQIASTIVVVSGLALPGQLIEIKVVAIL
jgi:enamine deaminase RidA (YjgF/YER057c/UK114 family)